MFGKERFLVEAQQFQQIKKTLDQGKGIRYSDFTEFQNMKDTDFANAKKWLEVEIAGIPTSSRTPEDKKGAEKMWGDMLSDLKALEADWKANKIQITNHIQENYTKTADLAKGKLGKLLGEVSAQTSLQSEAGKALLTEAPLNLMVSYTDVFMSPAQRYK